MECMFGAMSVWTRAIIAGAVTEGLFALCAILGEEPDIESGDVAGWIGLLGHLPVAFVAWLMGLQDWGSRPWMIAFGFVGWSFSWWILFALIRSREEQLRRVPTQ